MKTIGLLGGMSWESTTLYYQLINQAVKQRLGGLHSAPIALVSVDFHEIESLQHEGRWDEAGAFLARAASQVQAAGADCLLICTNTMHKVADAVEAAIDVPLLHVVDATAALAREAGRRRLGLLGTRFTMEQPFYRDRFAQRYSIDILVPGAAEREEVHRIIYEELCLGTINDRSRARMLEIIDGLMASGAEAIVEGCTEIGMLVGERHTQAPLYDTTAVHAEAAVTWALTL
ncbi:MAG: aspartate/glutamate racemase family protein [Pseudomonadota bacterium]